MEILETFSAFSIPPEVNTLLFIALAIYLFWYRKQRGVTQIDDETIKALRNQIDAIKGEFSTYKDIKEKERELKEKELDSMKLQILELTRLMGEKDGIIVTKNQQLQHYEEIFKNRNPELIQVLTEIRDFMKLSQSDMKDQTIILREIKIRNDSIDRAHGSVAHPEESRDISINGTMTSK